MFIRPIAQPEPELNRQILLGTLGPARGNRSKANRSHWPRTMGLFLVYSVVSEVLRESGACSSLNITFHFTDVSYATQGRLVSRLISAKATANTSPTATVTESQ